MAKSPTQPKPKAAAPVPAPAVPPAAPPISTQPPPTFIPSPERLNALEAGLARLAEVDGISGEAAKAELLFRATEAGVKALLAEPMPRLEGREAAAVRIRVTGPQTGRWRAGRHFTAEPTTIAVDRTAFEAIRNDPQLTHVVLSEI